MNVVAAGKRVLTSGEQSINIAMTNTNATGVQTIKTFMDKFVNIKQSADTATNFTLEDLVVAPSAKSQSVTYPVPCMITGTIEDTSLYTPERFTLTFNLVVTDIASASTVYTAADTAFVAMQDQGSPLHLNDSKVKVTEIQVIAK